MFILKFLQLKRKLLILYYYTTWQITRALSCLSFQFVPIPANFIILTRKNKICSLNSVPCILNSAIMCAKN